MRGHSRFSRWIPLIGILGFLFGCLLGIVIPEKEEVPQALPTTEATTVPTAASTTEPTLSREEQWIAEFLADSGEAIRRIDLDLDGSEELLRYRGDTLIQVCTVSPEGVISLMESYALFLCENGIIMFNDPLFDSDIHTFYSIGPVTGEGNESKIIDQIAYSEWDESWVRNIYGDTWDQVLISDEEAMEIIASYGRVKLDLKPISEFPMDK